MKQRIRIVGMSVLLASAASAQAPPSTPLASTKPVKVTAAAAQGPIFSSAHAVKDNGPDGPTLDVVLARSKDGKFQSGLYSAGPSEQDIAEYPEDEFMFFIRGGVILTSADGSKLIVKAG